MKRMSYEYKYEPNSIFDNRARNLQQFAESAFLAELFRGMLFKWKGANKKSHQK